MIDFQTVDELEDDPPPRCVFCHVADMIVDESFPDNVVYRCQSCFMRALPRQIKQVRLAKRIAAIVSIMFALLLFGLVLVLFLAFLIS